MKKSLGQVIREKRVEKRKKSYEVAQGAGITKQYYSAIENERITPSIKTLYRISKSLGVNIEDLFVLSNFNEVGENKTAS